MAIPINPGNFSALAALAGSRIGGLGLKIPGQLGLERDKLAAQQSNQSANRHMQKQQLDARQQQQGIQNELSQRKMALAEQESESNVKYKEALISQLDSQAELLAEGKDKEKVEGMLGAASVLTQMSTQELDENRTSIVSGLVKSNLIEKEEGEKLIQMNPTELKAMSKAALYTSNKALQMMKAEKSGDSIELKDPETGELVHRSTKTTKSVVNDQQKKLIDSQVILDSLHDLSGKYQDKFLTYKGRIRHGVLKKLDNLGYANKEQKAEVGEMTDFVTHAEQLFQQYRKAVTGSQASDAEIKMLREIFLNPEMSPAEFKAALNGLLERVSKEANIRGGAIVGGTQTFKARNGKSYTNEQLENAAKKMKISVKELQARIK